MIISLWTDHNLRGYTLEYACRIILRRQRQNNFIFLMSQFDSIDEILSKYRLKIGKQDTLIAFLRKNWKRTDIIEFVLNNPTERAIEQILFYDVKTKIHSVQREYFESCLSNHNFMEEVNAVYGAMTHILSVIIFDNWRFSFTIIPYMGQNIRVYSRAA